MTNSIKLLALALVVAGCGHVDAPKADEQKVSPIAIPGPASSEGAPFMLAGDSDRVTYGGNLLMWHADVSRDQIAAVAKASVDGRVQKAGNLRFKSDELAPLAAQVTQLTAARQTLAIDIAKAKAEGGRLAAALRPAVGGWFEKRLAELKTAPAPQRISAADAEHARTYFAAYCEYKIWELATNPVLKNKFAARPTPLQMCEPYYARAGLLKDAPDATLCADTGARKDYFSCLWSQGVLQTKVFKGKLDNAACDVEGLTRAAAITNWVGMPEFRAALFDSELADGIQSYGALLNEAILARGTIPSELRDKYPFFQDCKRAFRNDLTLPNEPNWEYASLLELKSIAEGPGDGTEVYTLLPKTGDAMRDHERHALLAAPIAAFAQRSVTDAAVNDQIFNQNAQGTVRAGEYFFGLYQAAPEFGAVRAEEDKAVPQDLRDAAASLDASLADVSTRRDAANATMQERVAELSKRTLAGVKAVGSPGATTLFVPFTLEVTKGAAAIQVALTFGEGAPGVHSIVGCAALAPATGCSVPAVTAGTLHKTFDVAAYEISSGKLTLDVKLDELAALGLAHHPRAEGTTTYNELTEEALNHRVLRLEAYANRVDGTLRIVTGKAVIVEAFDRDGIVLHEGSFSADDYASQTVGQR